MPRHIETPTVVEAAGNKPKQIQEFIGRVNSGHDGVSVARMVSPGGWVEPGQRPDFDEMTIVLKGLVRVEHEGGVIRPRRASSGHVGRRVDPLQQPRAGGRRVHRGVSAGVLTSHGAPRFVGREARLKTGSYYVGRFERRLTCAFGASIAASIATAYRCAGMSSGRISTCYGVSTARRVGSVTAGAGTL